MRKIKNKRSFSRVKPEALVYTLKTDDYLNQGTINDALIDWFEKNEAGEFALDNKSIVIVDQTQQINTRLMHKLLKLITESNSKLVLFGSIQSRFIKNDKFVSFGENQCL